MLKLKKTIRKHRKGQAGFTLLDMAISMLVIGLIGAGLLHTYKVYQERKARDMTNSKIMSIRIAMDNYYFANGFYPCPAQLTLSADDAGHGEARDCSTITDVFVVGGVPFKELQIPMDLASDGWGNKYQYTVMRNMTLTQAAFRTAADAYAAGTAALTVTAVDEDWNAVAPSNAHYVVISTGNDGAGGFTAEGQPTGIACPVSAQPRQGMNCDNDRTFFMPTGDTLSMANNQFYMDDIMVLVTAVPTNIWMESDNPGDIVTDNLRIGIGTRTPTVSVDVSGNIYAEDNGATQGNVNADRFCNGQRGTRNLNINGVSVDLDRCFDPVIIGGDDHVNCAAQGGIMAIRGGRKECNGIPSSAVNGTCPNGQYVTEIRSGGAVVCN